MAAVSLTPAFLDDLTSTLSEADAVTLRGILPAVYDDLRRVAAGFMQGERLDHTLQPTALVHEAYLRVAGQRQSTWQNRAHLLGVFARMMRRILIDHASARFAAKRGGKEAVRIILDDELEIYQNQEINVLKVDEALRNLEQLDPTQAQVVELRFFGGLTIDEIAEALSISPATVSREWAIAKRWLQRELSRGA
ncbi:MAG TPA: ECF-type sigma factor [Chthoniobacterales bacterium]|nr:ECF-type sigma factor [Chthoniobacterales bacterium]